MTVIILLNTFFISYSIDKHTFAMIRSFHISPERRADMKSIDEISFGEYIKVLRIADDRSLRQTAIAIGVTPQFYSDVEKRDRSWIHTGAFGKS